MISGLALIDKPAGFTSHDVVAKLRKTLGTKKVGHAGTLDPMATGLLLIGVGAGTRLLHYLVGESKSYLATIALGVATSTDDAEGEAIGEVSTLGQLEQIDAAAIERELSGLRGEIMQLPTRVSAIKVDGKRAHELVRSGAEFELKPRPVTISKFERTSALRIVDGLLEFDAAVECSSGTYVRALARDLGAALGVGGHLRALRRTRIGAFEVTAATAVDSPKLLDIAEVAQQLMPAIAISDQVELELRHGKRPLVAGADGLHCCINDARELVAIVNRSANQLRSEVVFAR